jgi:hypothetical protein
MVVAVKELVREKSRQIGDSTVVEHWTTDPEIECSNPVTVQE